MSLEPKHKNFKDEYKIKERVTLNIYIRRHMSILVAFEWHYFQELLNWWHSPFNQLLWCCINYFWFSRFLLDKTTTFTLINIFSFNRDLHTKFPCWGGCGRYKTACLRVKLKLEGDRWPSFHSGRTVMATIWWRSSTAAKPGLFSRQNRLRFALFYIYIELSTYSDKWQENCWNVTPWNTLHSWLFLEQFWAINTSRDVITFIWSGHICRPI